MKNLSALAFASVLGLALIPGAASAQEYGGVPNNAYRQAESVTGTTPVLGFQALATGHAERQCIPGPDCDWTPSQLEGLLSIH